VGPTGLHILPHVAAPGRLVRAWKLYLPLAQKFIANNRRMAPGQLQLFNVRNDVGETRAVSAENAETVQRLTALAEVRGWNLVIQIAPAKYSDSPDTSRTQCR
jgi:hypothetical protein